jgi:ATP-binding cassette subfamily B protein
MPFLRLLASPAEGIAAFGPFGNVLKSVPEKYLLIILALGFMGAVIISVALRVLTIRSQLRLAALITADLGGKIFTAVLKKPYRWHLQTNSSQVLTFLTRDVYSALACLQAVMTLGVSLAVVIPTALFLVALSPVLMLSVVALIGIFYLLVFNYTKNSLRADGETQMIANQKLMQVVQEGLGGIRDVLLDRTYDHFFQVFLASNKAEKLSAASINIKAQVPRYLIEGFTMIVIVGASLFLALQGRGVEQQLPLLGALALGAFRLLQPIQQCFGAVSNFQANKVALERLAPFLIGYESEPPDTSFTDLNRRLTAPEPPLVRLCNVDFRYSPGNPLVLKNINLTIQRGEHLAFVGTTGSGKSTTGDLILGLLEPSAGKVLINGSELNSSSALRSWQSCIAHVPQHIYLSDSSFASNIAFGIYNENIDYARVYASAQQARIAEFIESSPNGYQTIVGERGVRLSGGQRQRIGLARALYKNAKLLLLDEATSALDTHTEAEVMDAISGLNREITVILIAHRLTTIEKCDRVVVMEGGKITGCDTYSRLMDSHPYFVDKIRVKGFDAV